MPKELIEPFKAQAKATMARVPGYAVLAMVLIQSAVFHFK